MTFCLLRLTWGRLARFNCWNSLGKFHNAHTLILSSNLCRNGAVLKKISPNIKKWWSEKSLSDDIFPATTFRLVWLIYKKTYGMRWVGLWLDQCRNWSYVPTGPMNPLILCSHRFYKPTDPMCPLILCSHRFYFPANPMFPLILCTRWSCIPTYPMNQLIQCSNYSCIPTDPMFPLTMHPLILCSH